MKKVKGLFAGALALSVTASMCLGLADVKKADAASLKTNIFNETLEDDTLADNNKWITSKSHSTIDVKNVGKETLHYIADTTAGMIVLQQDDKITLGENQYVEYTVTFEGVDSSSVIDFAFVSDKLAENSTLEGVESMSFYTDPGWLKGCVNTANADVKLVGGWGNEGDANVATGLQWINGNASLGAPNAASGKHSWKARYYADGTAFYYVADAYADNFFNTATVGCRLVNWKFEKSVGFEPVTSGYPTIRVRNASEIFIGQAEVAVYDYTDMLNDGAVVDGTLNGAVKSDDISNAETALFKPVTGTCEMKSALRAITVDNLADDDLLIKKTKLGAPANRYAPNVYELKNELVVEATGTAEGVMYIGSSSQKDFSDATAIRFGAKNGKLTVTIDDKTVETDTYLGAKFELTILTDGSMKNDVYVDGKKMLSFEKDISDKYIAFGTKGVNANNKAIIGVIGAEYKRYDYQQGNGGDFTETFDNGKYNKANMAFAYRVEDLQNYMYADKVNGRLTISNIGYTGVISTKQTYGDFDFAFEIASLGTTLLDDGTTAPCNFLISWGRAAAESDYASGGCGVYLVWGNDLNIMGNSEVKYADGYGAWCNFNLPTDKKDDDGNPLGTSASLWDYNFSEGNIVFRTIKKDHRVEIYCYTAESAENSASRVNPICVLENDYSFGYVGICGVPTGKPMSMQLDSFSIKNLDEHKADNLIVGTDADITDLDFTPAQGDDDIPDPFESESKDSGNGSSGTSEKSSCKGGIGLSAAILCLLGGAVVFAAKNKEKN